jgi:hypothetical protein
MPISSGLYTSRSKSRYCAKKQPIPAPDGVGEGFPRLPFLRVGALAIVIDQSKVISTALRILGASRTAIKA